MSPNYLIGVRRICAWPETSLQQTFFYSLHFKPNIGFHWHFMQFMTNNLLTPLSLSFSLSLPFPYFLTLTLSNRQIRTSLSRFLNQISATPLILWLYWNGQYPGHVDIVA